MSPAGSENANLLDLNLRPIPEEARIVRHFDVPYLQYHMKDYNRGEEVDNDRFFGITSTWTFRSLEDGNGFIVGFFQTFERTLKGLYRRFGYRYTRVKLNARTHQPVDMNLDEKILYPENEDFLVEDQ